MQTIIGVCHRAAVVRRVSIAMMFFIAGAIKLWTLSGGHEAVEDLPYLAVGPAGAGIAIVEMAIGAAVLVGRSA